MLTRFPVSGVVAVLVVKKATLTSSVAFESAMLQVSGWSSIMDRLTREKGRKYIFLFFFCYFIFLILHERECFYLSQGREEPHLVSEGPSVICSADGI